MSKQADWERLAHEILARGSYRERLRHLATKRAVFDENLVASLVARARREMRKNPGLAVEAARLGGNVAAAIADRAGHVSALRVLGQAYTLHGRFPAALRAFDRALANQDEPRVAAELDCLRIYPLAHLERHLEARTAGHRALALFEELHIRQGILRAHMALADVAFRTDRPRRALAHYSKVDKLLGPDAPARLRGALAANRANALEARNRFRAAQRQFARARDLFAREGCDHALAQVEYNAAYGQALRGAYDEALRGYARTEATFLKTGDERHLALIDLERAEIHLHLHMPDEAGVLAGRAHDRFAQLCMGKEQALSLQLAGGAAELEGRLEDAESLLVRGQDLFEEIGLAERQLSCAVQRGQIALRQEREPHALRLLDQARALVCESTPALAAASVELLHVRLDLRRGRATEALHRADSVRMRYRRVHAPWLRVELHRLIGQGYAARGQLDEAILAHKHAIEQLERYRGGVPPDEYMSAFLAGRSDLYAETVDLLARRGLGEMAFEFTERAKSRALVDLLADRRRDAFTRTLSTGRLHHLRDELNATYQRLFRFETSRCERGLRATHEMRRHAEELEQEMARLLREARHGNREAVSLEAAETVDLATVRRDLDGETTLLEFMVTPHGLVTFLVSRDQFKVVRQKVSSGALRRMIDRFRFHCSQFAREEPSPEELVLEATRANLQKLAGHLLAPVADLLRTPQLVIVPHGLLHAFPFHALPWGEGWLADRFEVAYAPSAAVYGYCGDKGVAAHGPACVFGLPDEVAPEIGREAEHVAQILGDATLHLGADATLPRLREAARRARVLHIATHGMFRKRQPMLSSIRLADTWLNLYDIYSLDLGAELVVLSTCESGTAGVTGGDEILGLTRGFLYAGARTLLTSQWRVDDRATADLMESFYRHFEAVDPAAALQAAMADVRKKHPHPYYWAPFFLTGRPFRNTERASGHATHRNSVLQEQAS